VAGARRRGFWSSFQFATLIGGQLLALGVLILLQGTLSEAALRAWGWRIPFLIGAALAVVVFAIQSGLDETGAFRHQAPDAGRASRIAHLIGRHPRETAIVFVLSSAGGLAFYAYTTYMQKFLTNTAGFSAALASEISAGSLIAYLLAIPLFGALGDLVGRKRLLAAAFGLGAAAAWPVMNGIAHAHDAAIAFGLATSAILILSGYSAVNAVVKAELFPTAVRGLGVALPYAVGNAIFGGTAEYVALWFKQAKLESGFFVYLALVQGAGCIAALLMPDTQKLGLLVDD
jgi:MHS family alpha-ketoglutarate permease-like MFS transporter